MDDSSDANPFFHKHVANTFVVQNLLIGMASRMQWTVPKHCTEHINDGQHVETGFVFGATVHHVFVVIAVFELASGRGNDRTIDI